MFHDLLRDFNFINYFLYFAIIWTDTPTISFLFNRRDRLIKVHGHAASQSSVEVFPNTMRIKVWNAILYTSRV